MQTTLRPLLLAVLLENIGGGEATPQFFRSQTPIEADIRKTGSGDQTDAKSTAVQESGSSDPLVEGGGNQGTEKR